MTYLIVGSILLAVVAVALVVKAVRARRALRPGVPAIDAPISRESPFAVSDGVDTPIPPAEPASSAPAAPSAPTDEALPLPEKKTRRKSGGRIIGIGHIAEAFGCTQADVREMVEKGAPIAVRESTRSKAGISSGRTYSCDREAVQAWLGNSGFLAGRKPLEARIEEHVAGLTSVAVSKILVDVFGVKRYRDRKTQKARRAVTAALRRLGWVQRSASVGGEGGIWQPPGTAANVQATEKALDKIAENPTPVADSVGLEKTSVKPQARPKPTGRPAGSKTTPMPPEEDLLRAVALIEAGRPRQAVIAGLGISPARFRQWTASSTAQARTTRADKGPASVPGSTPTAAHGSQANGEASARVEIPSAVLERLEAVWRKEMEITGYGTNPWGQLEMKSIDKLFRTYSEPSISAMFRIACREFKALQTPADPGGDTSAPTIAWVCKSHQVLASHDSKKRQFDLIVPTRP